MDSFAGFGGAPVTWATGATWLEFSGDDCLSWLQGQVTQDMNLLDSGDRETLLTTPTGQLLAHGFCHLSDDRVLIVTHQPEQFEKRADMFVVTEDVTVRRLPGLSWTVQGAADQLGSLSGLLAILDAPRITSVGVEILLAEGKPAFEELSEDLQASSTLAAGFPFIGIDTTEKTLPPELGDVFYRRTTSLTKGCFTGQEVLQRIHSRGHTNKLWVALRGATELSAGSRVLVGSEPVGVVTRSAHHPKLGWIAGAVLRNEACVSETIVNVGAESATVAHFPLV